MCHLCFLLWRLLKLKYQYISICQLTYYLVCFNACHLNSSRKRNDVLFALVNQNGKKLHFFNINVHKLSGQIKCSHHRFRKICSRNIISTVCFSRTGLPTGRKGSWCACKQGKNNKPTNQARTHFFGTIVKIHIKGLNLKFEIKHFDKSCSFNCWQNLCVDTENVKF